MSTKSVALILGYGPNVGASVAKKLASQGFRVAVASRSGAANSDGFLSLKADFTQPSSISGLFDSVKKEFNAPPSVVVYNAALTTKPPDEKNLFSLPVDTVQSEFNANTISAYVAAQQAVNGWATLPDGTKKTFIYTGNILNTTVWASPFMMSNGMGKSAAAYWIGVADQFYSSQGAR
jgi:NAD(P)-dependent dehydrogenase (short-subunit alcohol dehydrogenase family)